MFKPHGDPARRAGKMRKLDPPVQRQLPRGSQIAGSALSSLGSVKKMLSLRSLPPFVLPSHSDYASLRPAEMDSLNEQQ